MKLIILVAVPSLLYGCATWSLMKCLEKERRDFHKDAACCFENILKTAPRKRVVELTLVSHITYQDEKYMLDAAKEIMTNSS